MRDWGWNFGQSLELGAAQPLLSTRLFRLVWQCSSMERCQVVVRGGKGAKDRVTMLAVDPRGGKVRRHHLDPSTLQRAVSEAARKAGMGVKSPLDG